MPYYLKISITHEKITLFSRKKHKTLTLKLNRLNKKNLILQPKFDYLQATA